MPRNHRQPSATLKVLMVVGSLPPDLCGVGDFTARLAGSLDRDGCSVTVVGSGNTPPSQPTKRLHLRREMRAWHLSQAGRFFRILDEERPDIVHFQYPSRGYGWHILPNLLPFLLKIRRPDLPVVATLHEFRGLNIFRQASFLFFTLFSRALITPAREVRSGLETFFPWTRRKTTVIPVGSFLEPERGRPPRAAGKPLLVFPGFLLRRKGVEEAVRALAILKNEFQNIHLVFASDSASHRDVRADTVRLAERLGVTPHVDFIDALDAPHLAALMKCADLVVLPFHDGASTRRTTLISSLHLGCAVVTTEAEGMPGEFRNGGVVLCRPKDPGSLAEAVRRYLRDRRTRALLKKRVKRLASLFDWKRISLAHRTLYEDVLRRGR